MHGDHILKNILKFYYPVSCGSSCSQNEQGRFIAGVKKHEFALHPGSCCNTSVLFLSRPLSRTTDPIAA